MPQTPLATPLAGIRVLEFSHTVMGPTAGLVFAELGAEQGGRGYRAQRGG
jgi:crotonobetainyl-CoA:carnitine CoA-transferase CaiB-like acyl-CoA transferase